MANSNEAMREALSNIIDKIDGWRADGSMEHWQYSQLFDLANDALALPRRQCDVGTEKEQAKRLREFCKKHRDGVRRCSRCPVERIFPKDCTLAWAQMPYKEGGAK